MNRLLVVLLTVAFIVPAGLATAATAAEPQDEPRRPGDQERPNVRAEPDRGVPHDEATGEWKDRRAPRPRPGHPVGPPGGPPHGPGARRGPGGPGEPPVAPLLRMIAERRPELAERLGRLYHESPERFHDVLLDALMLRLEATLDKAEAEHERERDEHHERRPDTAEHEPGHPRDPHRPGPEGGPPHGPHPGMRPGAHPGPAGGFGPPALPPRLRELEERHADLERRSDALTAAYRELRARGAPEGEQRRVHEELERTVHEHFEVRTELRQLELERLEHEIMQLRRHLEHLREQFEQRSQRREAIIERQIRHLIGEDMAGW